MATVLLHWSLLFLSLKTSLQDQFRPLRIVPFFYELETVLDDRGQERLKTVTSAAIDDVQKILSVLPVDGNLVLKRSLSQACTSVISKGPNIHKCAQVNGAYLNDGERCDGEFRSRSGVTILSHDQIPDEHLGVLEVWNSTWEQPLQTVFTAGEGVKDADFILYVQAMPAAKCVKSNALAYTKHCAQAASWRPLAAYVNICPKLVMDIYRMERAQQIVVHELFHALAMSRDLFKTFTECHPSGCTVRNVIVEDIDRLPVVVTPAVVQRARDHFNCPSEQKRYLGVPLHMENGRYTSHWDERFMQSSIMVPSIGLAHQTVVDEITLAVFDDTGWYQVNYSMAQPLAWGKGRGCDFLQNNYCASDNQFFCQTNASICSRELMDKATCTSVDNCLIPKSKSGIGRCYEHRCNRTGLLEIRVRDGPWVVCASGTSVHVVGFSGSVLCPSDGILCLVADPPPPTPAPPTTTVDPDRTTPFPYNSSEDVALRIELQFSQLPYHMVTKPSDRFIFTRSVITSVVRYAGVNEKRIVDVTIDEGSVSFVFTLNPDPLSFLSTKRVYDQLETAVLGGVFVVEFSGVSLRPEVISCQVLIELEEEERNHVTIAVAIAIAVLVFVVLIIVSVLLWNRYQKRQAESSVSSTSRQELTNFRLRPVIGANGIRLHSGCTETSFETRS